LKTAIDDIETPEEREQSKFSDTEPERRVSFIFILLTVILMKWK